MAEKKPDEKRPKRMAASALKALGEQGISQDFGAIELYESDGQQKGQSHIKTPAPSPGSTATDENPKAPHPNRTSFGNLIIDGLQRLSMGFKMDTQSTKRPRSGTEVSDPPTSASAPTGPGETPAVQEPQKTRPGMGQLIVDGIQRLSGGFKRAALSDARAESATEKGQQPPSSQSGEAHQPGGSAVGRWIMDGIDRITGNLGRHHKPGRHGHDKTTVLHRSAAQQWAEEFDQAFYQLAPDEGVIYKLLASRSQAQRQAIDAAYTQQFAMDLDMQLRFKLEGRKLARALHLLYRTDAAQLAEQMLAACSQKRTDVQTVQKILQEKTPVQIRELDAYYRATYETSLEKELKDNLSGNELQAVLERLRLHLGPGMSY